MWITLLILAIASVLFVSGKIRSDLVAIGLLFVGSMTIHQYSAGKTVLTMFLSVIVMLIIVFLGTLVFSMMQQIYTFLVNVYREIIFRQ